MLNFKNNNMKSTIDELLEEAQSVGCIGMDKSQSIERHKAFNQMVGFELIKEHGDPLKKHKSSRLTAEGYRAIELGGFKKWQARKGRLNRIYIVVGIVGVTIATLAIFYDRIPTT